jgi:hypothetical protein
VIVVGAANGPLRAELPVEPSVNWAGYANENMGRQIEQSAVRGAQGARVNLEACGTWMAKRARPGVLLNLEPVRGWKWSEIIMN